MQTGSTIKTRKAEKKKKEDIPVKECNEMHDPDKGPADDDADGDGDQNVPVEPVFHDGPIEHGQ